MGSKKWNFQEVKEYIESFGYKLLSEKYVNNKTNLLIECNYGHIFKATFHNFKDNNSRCPCCNKFHYRYTHEEVEKYFATEGYVLLDKYKTCNDKVTVLCPYGHKWEVSFSSFKNANNRCSYCKGNARYTYEYIKEYIESFGYKLLSIEYKNSKEKIFIECDYGHKYETNFSNFKNANRRCPLCYENRRGNSLRLSYEEVKNVFEKEKYKLLSTEYKNSHTPLVIKCPRGHITNTMSYGNFRNGARCPKCFVSKGEQKIISWLDKSNIKYIYQKSYDDLLGINGGFLSYDFYLLDYNLLIEYQGEYHDGSVSNQTEVDFIRQQEHDRRKREYAKKNNIKLLEIWYWDFDNIEDILKGVI